MDYVVNVQYTRADYRIISQFILVRVKSDLTKSLFGFIVSHTVISRFASSTFEFFHL